MAGIKAQVQILKSAIKDKDEVIKVKEEVIKSKNEAIKVKKELIKGSQFAVKKRTEEKNKRSHQQITILKEDLSAKEDFLKYLNSKNLNLKRSFMFSKRRSG
ncbi:hypothetical protein C6P44_004707 [Monosporozyma unispora]|nr:hypothetical protein C6P44_004707 [Kazachstania unispora]